MTEQQRRQRARNWLIDGRIRDGYPYHNAPVEPPEGSQRPAPLIGDPQSRYKPPRQSVSDPQDQPSLFDL